MARHIQSSNIQALLISALLLSVRAESFVHTKSKYDQQLMTSTTLSWLSNSLYSSSHEIVIGGFEVVEEGSDTKEVPIFVCRAFHNGIPLVGDLKKGDKKCVINSLGTVISYNTYDLLENIDSAARISWVNWSKYKDIPEGTASTSNDEKYFIARLLANERNNSFGQTHYIGTLNAKEGLGKITYIKMNGLAESANEGQVLVETEPILYNLNSVKLNFNKKKEKTHDRKILGRITLKNTGSLQGEMEELFSYQYNYSQYWGQSRAVLKGLNTSITLQNKTKLSDIVWGIPENKVKTDLYPVKYQLDSNTAVNVTILGTHVDMEIPYAAELIAIYKDNAIKSRSISGVRQEETTVDVRAKFSPVYFLNNNSLVPTTVPPPTTSTTTVTTTTVTTRDPESILMKEISGMEESILEAVDENMIESPRKVDGSNLQNDDGGPLSLKNKVEGDNSLGRISLPNILTIMTSVAIAYLRIT